MMKKVMLIGYGAMAQAVIERLPPQVRGEWIRRTARPPADWRIPAPDPASHRIAADR
jgi:pyrroline-5-carboxylate reductase